MVFYIMYGLDAVWSFKKENRRDLQGLLQILHRRYVTNIKKFYNIKYKSILLNFKACVSTEIIVNVSIYTLHYVSYK